MHLRLPSWVKRTNRDQTAIGMLPPQWYLNAWRPDQASIDSWNYQASLPNGEEPIETLRKNAMHQAFSLDFYQEIPKDFVTILDVGCSDGWMCKQFKEDKKKPIGVNDFLYPTDHKFIKENSLDIRIGTMEALEFPDCSFDAVWMRHSLEHSIAPLLVLSECHRVLKEGGYLFIALPPFPEPPLYYPGHYSIIPLFQLEYFMKIYRFDILKLYQKPLTWEREGDNLEIRCIAKKTDLPPRELHLHKI